MPDARDARGLRYRVREDASRIQYAPHGPTETPARDLPDVTKLEDLSPGVYEVRIGGDSRSYIYKDAETPLYLPADTEELLRELRNLERSRGAETLVRLIAVVVSANPYQTAFGADGAAVFRGILIEHHPNGTLQAALRSPLPEASRPWRLWALQAYGPEAVQRRHQRGPRRRSHRSRRPRHHSGVAVAEDARRGPSVGKGPRIADPERHLGVRGRLVTHGRRIAGAGRGTNC